MLWHFQNLILLEFLYVSWKHAKNTVKMDILMYIKI